MLPRLVYCTINNSFLGGIYPPPSFCLIKLIHRIIIFMIQGLEVIAQSFELAHETMSFVFKQQNLLYCLTKQIIETYLPKLYSYILKRS